MEMSVSIVAVRCRACSTAARWKDHPAQSTIGVASANASHSQPPNCSGDTIDSTSNGTVKRH